MATREKDMMKAYKIRLKEERKSCKNVGTKLNYGANLSFFYFYRDKNYYNEIKNLLRHVLVFGKFFSSSHVSAIFILAGSVELTPHIKRKIKTRLNSREFTLCDSYEGRRLEAMGEEKVTRRHKPYKRTEKGQWMYKHGKREENLSWLHFTTTSSLCRFSKAHIVKTLERKKPLDCRQKKTNRTDDESGKKKFSVFFLLRCGRRGRAKHKKSQKDLK